MHKNEPITSFRVYGYNGSMSARKHRIISRFASLLVALCLFAAPLCASCCTFSFCASPGNHEPSASSCHHSSRAPSSCSMLVARIAPDCLPAESLFATLPASQSRLLAADSCGHAHFEIPVSPSPAGTAFLIESDISSRGFSPGDSALFVSNPPLRL
jgi:hypothetical protein